MIFSRVSMRIQRCVGGLAAQGGFEFGAGDGGGPAFHHHDSARIVRQMRRFEIRSARGHREREHGDYGIARARHVDRRIRTVDRNVPRREDRRERHLRKPPCRPCRA